MYRVTNTSLNEVLKKYGVDRLESLTDDQLIDAQAILNMNAAGPKLYSDKLATKNSGDGMVGTGAYRPLQRFDVIEAIEEHCRAWIYMDKSYWPSEMVKRANEMALPQRLLNVSTGEETYELMSKLDIALNGLRAGQSVNVAWTKRWVDEFLAGHPICTKIEIVNLDNNCVLKRRAVVEGTGMDKKTTYSFSELEISDENDFKSEEKQVVDEANSEIPDLMTMKWNDLLELAKHRDISIHGKTRAELVKKVADSYIKSV